MIPQLLVLALTILGLVRVANLHGKPIEPPSSKWIPISAVLVLFGLYWWGGFFNNFAPITKDDLPQVLIFTGLCIRVGLLCAEADEQPKKHNAFVGIPSGLFLQWILYIGGFYDCFFNQ